LYGVPLPRIAYRLGPYIDAGLTAARDAHSKIFATMGATEIQHRDTAEGAGHIMGTARMGNDQKDSVVHCDLRSHDHGNLFILGSAVFPRARLPTPRLPLPRSACARSARSKRH
jgi:glucose dehydrogenase